MGGKTLPEYDLQSALINSSRSKTRIFYLRRQFLAVQKENIEISEYIPYIGDV